MLTRKEFLEAIARRRQVCGQPPATDRDLDSLWSAYTNRPADFNWLLPFLNKEK